MEKEIHRVMRAVDCGFPIKITLTKYGNKNRSQKLWAAAWRPVPYLKKDNECHLDCFEVFSCCPQRFQKCEYAKTKLFRTKGCGWGLLADDNIKVILLKQLPI
ncbi:hypothetical protein MTR67_030142 [Solanum verrucosum]|uniref:Uncharacterized protein n=1 Tax=Solanum verrucosum TaxID=315347 RepID=A0AAF0TXF2_SOLVR|nr:hypothetical protein MTR67_030142 [Solanum verrucosum]